MNKIETWLPDEAAIFLRLDLAQRGAYSSLRQLYFLTEGPLTETSIKTGCPALTIADEKAVAFVLSCFYVKKNNHWIHPSYQKVIDEALRKRMKEAVRSRESSGESETTGESSSKDVKS